MNRVKRGIIMAAGKGPRMRPLTFSTPKPLVRVNDCPIIETAIKGLIFQGITELYVVTGYLKEQFSYLEKKYPGLTLIENPLYDTCNNISSLYFARHHLEESIVLDGDQIINNTNVLSPDFERSGYNSVYTENGTNEWLQSVQNGVVTACSRTGGKTGWQLFSISRWTKEDGRKLKQHLELEFDILQNRQIYWDDIPQFLHASEYHLGIYPMQYGDVIEIDSLEELAELDCRYRNLIINNEGASDQ